MKKPSGKSVIKKFLSGANGIDEYEASRAVQALGLKGEDLKIVKYAIRMPTDDIARSDALKVLKRVDESQDRGVVKITASQLRSIIKEEVSRALREAPVRDHERPDEARSSLYLGMKKWIDDPEAGWPMITSGISGLIDHLMLSPEDVMDEVFELEQELGYSDDDMLDLDTSVRDWLQSGD